MTNHTNRVAALAGKRDLLQTELESEQRLQTATTQQYLVLERSKFVIQAAAQATQQQLEYRIGTLVTLALAHVFPDPYALVLRFDCKRGRTEANFLFRDVAGNEIEPMEASGGGVWDVASLALRIALWSLRHPKGRATLILDEPFKFLQGTENQQKVAGMIRELSKRLKLQFIIVTSHNWDASMADAIFHVARTKPEPSTVRGE